MSKCLATKNRFNLEDDIHECWGITNDLHTLTERLLDGLPGSPDLTVDQIANIMIGLKDLYDVKFQKLWDTFTQVHELDCYSDKAVEFYNRVEEEKRREKKGCIDFDIDLTKFDPPDFSF